VRTPRFTESSIYPYLETNVDLTTMQFSQEPIGGDPSEWSVAMHGSDTPFRPWTVMRDYVQNLVRRNGYEQWVEYGTTVERADKVGQEWKLILRKEIDADTDHWWEEYFDAVVVASGHFSVPYVPHVDGLDEFQRQAPGSVIHSKQFRGREAYHGKVSIVPFTPTCRQDEPDRSR
jgi:cation diffusion facilitator CzcD-associated flavoprotein CzcO